MTDTLEMSVNERRQLSEQNFIACAFSSPDTARERCGWLSPEQFRDPKKGAFWKKILDGIDPAQAAVDLGFYDISSWVLQAELFNYDPAVSANILVEESWLQSASESLPELARAIAEHRIDDIKNIMGVITKSSPGNGLALPDFADLALDFIASLDNDRSAVRTLIPTLDNAMGGLWRQALTIICARPSVGKTALAWQIARNVAENNHKVLFVSLEMHHNDLIARAVCGALRIPYQDVIAHRITADVAQQVRDKTVELIDLYQENMVFIDATRKTTADVWRLAEQVKPDLVIVDHLRLLADSTKENEVKRQGMISENMKNIAKDFDCAAVVCAQLSRKSESRTGDDKRPTMADLRDSGEIEETADIVLGIHREKEYLEKPKERTPADVIVLKFRNGMANQVMHMVFDGMGQWFEPADQRRYKL